MWYKRNMRYMWYKSVYSSFTSCTHSHTNIYERLF